MTNAAGDRHLVESTTNLHTKLNFSLSHPHLTNLKHTTFIVLIGPSLKDVDILQPVVSLVRVPQQTFLGAFLSFFHLVVEQVTKRNQFVDNLTTSLPIPVELENRNSVLVLIVVEEEESHVEKNRRDFIKTELL